MPQKINVGLIGWGTVGTGVSKILLDRQSAILENSGLNLQLAKIAKRKLPVDRKNVILPENCLTTDVSEVVDNPKIDVVVELIGGTTASRNFVIRALQNGKHVVTANKALIAEHGSELFQLAKKKSVSLNFEAAVAGGIPIVKAFKDSFTGNEIISIDGIVNGTCNYILSKMQSGETFEIALSDAQEKGYAETDPTLDIDGTDSAQKLSILASLAYGIAIPSNSIYLEGITGIAQKDVNYARELGYIIKLIAMAKLHDDRLELRVHPSLVPARSMIAHVAGAFNAVCVSGSAVGPTMFYGQGAGEMPTASAVVADIVEAGKSIVERSEPYIPKGWLGENSPSKISICSMGEIETRYYLRLVVEDRPNVLAQVSAVLGKHQISIASVMQKESHGEDYVSLLILTHRAMEKNLQQAKNELEGLETVDGDLKVIRIEEPDF